MIRFLLAGALACVAALPAAAQTAPDQKGDWWWLTNADSAQKGTIMLIDGPARRDGDIAAIQTYLLFREPNAQGVIGVKVLTRIDCKRETRVALMQRIYNADGTTDEPNVEDSEKPTPSTLALYQAACVKLDGVATHYGDRPRKDVSAEIFRANPAK